MAPVGDGARYDWTQYPRNPGHQWAVELYLTFLPSEFLRFRLAYKHHRAVEPRGLRSQRGGSGRIMDERTFQRATFILGVTRAHSF